MNHTADYIQLMDLFHSRNKTGAGAWLWNDPRHGVRRPGSPGTCHTFYGYLPPDKYFDEHPEWYSMNASGKITDTRAAALVFLNPSLRTRTSFELAMAKLGGHAVVLSPGADAWKMEAREGVVMDGAAAEHVREAARELNDLGEANRAYFSANASFPANLSDLAGDYLDAGLGGRLAQGPGAGFGPHSGHGPGFDQGFGPGPGLGGFEHMLPRLTDRLDLSDEQVAAIPAWSVAECWSPAERAVLAYTDCLVLDDGFQYHALERDLEQVEQVFAEIGGQIGWLASVMNFRFKQPVYLGETITCRFTIAEVDERRRASAEAVYFNQDGDMSHGHSSSGGSSSTRCTMQKV